MGLDVVGEGVDAPPAGARAGEVVQAVEQPAVDEGHGAQPVHEAVRVRQHRAVAVSGEVAVGRPGPRTEAALVDLGVQRGEEQVLEHGPVVVRAVGRVFLERAAGEDLVEQLLRNQPLLFQEPDEQQPCDEADDVPFGRTLSGAVVRKATGGDGALEPAEELPVEALVERLDVEDLLPFRVQVVEAADAGVDHARQREVTKDVDVRPVRVGGADVLDQRHLLQHVACRVSLVGAAVHGGQRHGRTVAEQDDDRHREAAIDRSGGVGQMRAGVGAVLQVGGHEQEGLRAARVEPRAVIEQVGLAADLAVGDLKHDLDSAPLFEQGALPVGQRLGGMQTISELRDIAHIGRAPAAVAERTQ